MGDELVNLNDVLMAMADSLMEKQPKPFSPQLKFNDKKIKYKIGHKPPREIFYRKTTTFLTALPPPVSKKLCSCRYMCMGDVANIKCHSCSIYDPRGVALFCQACFHAVHPWYRIAHIYTSIETEESIEHTLKIAHRIAEASRYEREGKDLLQGLQGEIPKLEDIGNDEVVDNKMRLYGRKMMALEEHIHEIRHRIKVDLSRSHTKSFVLPPSAPTSTDSVTKEDDKKVLKRGNSEIRRALHSIEPYREDYGVDGSPSPTQQVARALSTKKVVIVEEEHPETTSVRDSVVTAESVDGVEEVVDHHAEHIAEESILNSGVAQDTILPEEAPQSIAANESSDAKEEEDDLQQTVTEHQLHQAESKEDDEVLHVNLTIVEQKDMQEDDNGKPIDGEEEEVQHPQLEEPQMEEKLGSISVASYNETHIQAAVHIQRVFKGHIARKVISSLISLRIVRVFSPVYGRDYYFDRITGVSAWVAPKLLRPEHHDELEYIHEPSEKVIWTCKNTIAMLKMASDLSQIRNNTHKAVQIIQGFGRCILARHKVLSKLNHKYRRVLDTEDSTGSTFYYANIFSGETSWEKSKLFCASEPMVLDMEQLNQQENGDNNGKKSKKNKHKNKRSPRLNRIS